MSATQDARLSALDRVLDTQNPSAPLAEELFSVVDVVEKQPALRRALTDPSTSVEARGQLVSALFGGRVSLDAQVVLREAAKLRWSTGSGFAAALERQAVRALLSAAQSEAALDEVEDELFRFGRVVSGDDGLRSALADRDTSLQGRQELISDLLAGRVRSFTLALARRAVVARNRTYDLTLANYLTLASDVRQRAVARVVVARPLTPEQADRLRLALSRQLAREVNLQVSVDPTVLGGVRVVVGDEEIEGTVAGRLTEAERQIS
ncbi:MAG: F0F1 ATP synthase subunit delta [Micropruina sp.]|nr:F0F1 ATP synthase subunit delta [Micropruina sp.]